MDNDKPYFGNRMESEETQQARAVAKQVFEEKLDFLKKQAALAGFRISAVLLDPIEDAKEKGVMLLDSREILNASFHESIDLANQLGYNVRIDRKINPLTPRHPEVEVVLWPKRNEDGGYDE